MGPREKGLESLVVRRVVAIVPPWKRGRDGIVAPAPEDRIGRRRGATYR
jgi:hypothetical protein